MSRPTLSVIKIGGHVLDNEIMLPLFCELLKSIQGAWILVHGGGKVATDIGEKMGIESQYREGRRITDDAALELVVMVYAGLLNKKLVALLQSININALGISGADGNAVPAVKRSGASIDFGWVGEVDPDEINIAPWKTWIQAGMYPVLAPITHDQQGQLLNINADTMASVVATALSREYEVQLIYCFEYEGVLSDVRNPQSVIAEINPLQFNQMKAAGSVHKGMIPKLQNCFQALEAGVSEVRIGAALSISEMCSHHRGGTRLML